MIGEENNVKTVEGAGAFSVNINLELRLAPNGSNLRLGRT
jgi:hypothetical protein